MTKLLLLSEADLAEVRGIINACLSEGVAVYVFGSRAGGSPKPWSDLDLVIEGGSALPLEVLARLSEAFDESALAFKVDLVDRNAVSDAFGKIIDAQKIPLPH